MTRLCTRNVIIRWSAVGLTLCVVLVCALGQAVAESSPDPWVLLVDEGGKAREEARYDVAERLLSQALQEAEHDQPNGGRVAEAANNLGLLYHDQGRLGAARALYERALAIRQDMRR